MGGSYDSGPDHVGTGGAILGGRVDAAAPRWKNICNSIRVPKGRHVRGGF